MGTNYIASIKKSLSVRLFFSIILSNMMAFAQPIEQIIQRKTLNSKTSSTYYSGHPVAPSLYESSNMATAHTDAIESEKTNVKEIANSIVPSSFSIKSSNLMGVIGKESQMDSENPIDNYFEIDIPNDINLSDYSVTMHYDVIGVSAAAETTKSVNNQISYGGKIITKSKEWVSVNEKLNTSHLQNGTNQIFFNRRVDEAYKYKIKEVRLEFSKNLNANVSKLELNNYGGLLYVLGIVSTDVYAVQAGDVITPISQGVYEHLIDHISSSVKQYSFKYLKRDGTVLNYSFPITYHNNKIDHNFESSDLLYSTKNFECTDLSSSKLNFGNLSLEKIGSHSSAVVCNVALSGLLFKDLKSIPDDIENVTSGDYIGYKISLEAKTDSISLGLSYDPTLIPDGYTSKDVKTYYFNTTEKKWTELPIDSLDIAGSRIYSAALNEGETDYINGVIKVPESPETGSFAPTTISDIKYADPTSGIVTIQPPSPNSSGSMTTSFPLKLPAGRNGMQPSLEVSYNSEGGNGWMGMGWNISTPAITLNTKWGAPLFDSQYETELYSLNGSDLVLDNGGTYTNPHRDSNITRNNSSDRIFYQRKEGSYQKIIRHGSFPNYWWEIIDKMGNKNFYGENSSSQIKEGTNIAHWALSRTEDPYGNYVEYIYSSDPDVNLGSSEIKGQKFHINKIRYSRHNSNQNNYYEVAFIPTNYTVSHNNNLEPYIRTDEIVNAKNGYIQIINDVLTEVHISLVYGSTPIGKIPPAQLIRKYRFDYKKGHFEKPLLERISEFDAGGKLFYSNSMDYYISNDLGPVSNPSVLVPPAETFFDGVSNGLETPTIMNPIGSLFGSALGTSTSTGSTFGIRGGIGIGSQLSSVSNSLGGSFTYSKNTQNTKISFLDINGDGLPDKVYHNDNKIYYRPNDGSTFLGSIEISGIDQLTKSKSGTNSVGVDVNAFGMFGVGKSWSKTKTDTDYYFTDFNGDGLPDMVGGGRVKFNTSQQDQVSQRVFANDVTLSENSITAGAINQEMISYLNLPTLEDLREQHPQFDHVKVWKAPYTGFIKITTFAKLIAKNNDNINVNNFQLTVEKANSNQTSTTIIYSNSLDYINQERNFTSPSLQVNKGDAFYFRIHNLNNGYGGEVQFDPLITYSSISSISNVSQNDDTGKSINIYDAKQDYIMINGGGASLKSGSFSIDWNLNPALFPSHSYSDKIKFIVRRTRTVNTTINNVTSSTTTALDLFTRTYTPVGGLQYASNPNSINQAPLNSVDNYEFIVESPSNIKWQNIKWMPKIIQNGEISIAPVDYRIFDENVYENINYFDKNLIVAPVINNVADGNSTYMTITNNFLTTIPVGILGNIPVEQLPLEINWVVKGEQNNTVKNLRSETIYLHPSDTSPFYKVSNLKTNANSPLTSIQITAFENFNLTKNMAKEIKNSTNGRIYSAIYVSDRTAALGSERKHTLKNLTGATIANLYNPFYASTKTFFGTTYRGWSQFLYNGGIAKSRDNAGEFVAPFTTEDYSENIKVSLFDLEAQANNASNINFDADPDDMTITTGAPRYLLYNQLNQTNNFENKSIITAIYGFNSTGKLTAKIGRFGEGNLYDVYVDPNNLVSGGGTFVGIKQYSESNGTAISGNFVGANLTESKATSNVINQYIDLNGDSYPDLITRGKIQYTNMTGGLSAKMELNSFITGEDSEDTTQGTTAPGLFPNSTLVKKTNTNISAGINESDGSSFNQRQWIDINGDGLVDKVWFQKADLGSEVVVQLNKGYNFTLPMIWASVDQILITSNRSNTGIGINAGGDFNANASYAAGFGAAISTARANSFLSDVNGDQLPDLIVEHPDGTYRYYLNTGSRFLDTAKIFYNGIVEEDTSIAGNIYGSATFGTPIFLFITLKLLGSPTLGFNGSFNEKRITIQDIDGDGLNDVIARKDAFNNTGIKVKRNIVGNTNLLKKVNGPLGGSWTVEYTRSTNSYNMPHSKWLLSKVTTHDGFIEDIEYKPNATLSSFTYQNPNYDRRERQFLGFDTVETLQKYPANNATFRKAQTYYHNENYYLSGAQKGSALFDAQDQILTESSTLYNLLDPAQPTVNFAASAQNSFLQTSLTPSAADLLDKSRLFVAVAKTSSKTYEGSEYLSTEKEFSKYDSNGNLLIFSDNGSGGADGYKTVISYYDPIPTVENSVGYPHIISVYNKEDNTLYRQRTAEYNNKGKLRQIKTKLNTTEDNTMELEYDLLGNLNKVLDIDNRNAQNQIFTTNIVYVNIVKSYPIEVNNSFGEVSTTQYDYRFGVPVFTTDTNNQSMRTRIDNRGRMLEITGPNELSLETSSSSRWTIRMQYKNENLLPNNLAAQTYVIAAERSFPAVDPGATQPTTSQHWAVTRHYDSQFEGPNNAPSTNQILTISIVDGFGEAIQVKKTHPNGTASQWLLSGKEKKDAFGRVKENYLTTVQTSTQLPFTYNNNLPNLLSSKMTYDSKDRIIKLEHPLMNGIPEGTVTINYSISDGLIEQKTTNENGNTNSSFTDNRGRKVKTVENDLITTRFNYNAINELISTVNNANFFTNYIYDQAGRLLELQNPDRGIVKYKYDKKSRLSSMSNSNLILNGNQKVDYEYDFGRLTKITYPQNPHNEVKYTYGKNTDPFAVSQKAIGRLLYQEDASGVQVFGYGKMGEVTKNLRSVAVAGHQSFWFLTSWKYDSFNRVRQITYPDQEVVNYSYNTAGMLYSIKSNIGNQELDPIVGEILYNPYGEREYIKYGNNTTSTYSYDNRRRMETLSHQFTGYQVTKKYTFDKLSNIEKITTLNPSLVTSGGIGGPATHDYKYDNFNRLEWASGTYTGPNDVPNKYVQQNYELTMTYNPDHTIASKTQTQTQGKVPSLGGALTDEVPVYKNSYTLDYSNYGGTPTHINNEEFPVNSYGYVQPHAVNTIIEKPSWVTDISPDDPRIRHKEILYDKNGNQKEIIEKVGEVKTSLRKNLWDEENRLIAVDLKPDEPTSHPIAIYTYNAAGERVVRYNYDRIDVASNATEISQVASANIMIYPNGLLMAKIVKDKKDTLSNKLAYTKHYYIGAERISAKIGTSTNLGLYPQELAETAMPQISHPVVRDPSDQSVEDAGFIIAGVYAKFNQPAPVSNPTDEGNLYTNSHENINKTISFYFHPDHLGSSSYITNKAGIVSQHMEYLPFGETLVDEHLNSYNSPFKYNGKEFDAETGNYYYGARYYDPKWSIFISVDPLAEQTFDSYGYVYNNPINLIDPDGRAATPPNEYEINLTTGKQTMISTLGGKDVNFYHYKGGGIEYNGKTSVMNMNTYEEQWMSSSKYMLDYEHRDNTVNYSTIFNEFKTGTGPEKSLMGGQWNQMNTEILISSQFKSAVEGWKESGLDSKFYFEGTFGLSGVVKAGTNMTAQMLGKAGISFYPVGDFVAVMVTDSKSKTSWSLNPFAKSESNNIPRINGQGGPESTTHQTYIWIMPKVDLLKLVD